jgi:hypothetical protein
MMLMRQLNRMWLSQRCTLIIVMSLVVGLCRSAAPKQRRQGLIVVGGTPEQLAEFIAKDILIWRRVVKEAGIVAE